MTGRKLGIAVTAMLVALGIVSAADGRPPNRTAHSVAPVAFQAMAVHGARLAVTSLRSLPAAAARGRAYPMRGAVANTGDRAATSTVTIHLVRPGLRPRTVGSVSVRINAHATGRFAAIVRIPASLPRGSYALVACSHRLGGRGPLGCATAERHLLVGRAAQAPAAHFAQLSSLDNCSSGAHSLSAPGSRIYPQMGNGGYTSIHTDVTLVYDTATNLFLPGTHVDLSQQATQCLTDLSLDFEATSANVTAGPNMTVNSVLVNGQPATFAFVQPTYPGDPNGQNDPDPLAHAVSNANPVSATNPNPPACSPTVNGSTQNGQQCSATKLVITPSAPIPSGATYVVTVNYTGRPGVHNDGDGTTEGWFRNGTSGAFVTTEPVGTEAWMPLNNFPTAKPTYDFYDTTNLGKTAIANGELVSQTANAPDASFPAGSTTWHWHSPEPVASYLVENSIDSFDLSQSIGSNGIVYYEAQGSTITATRKASNKVVMDQQNDITSFQGLFNGPFPFTTDGVIVGVPSASFEEEMQTKITFAGGSISLGTFNHENMHQWWGDSVGYPSYNMVFWKEGWATVGEYLATARTAATAAGGIGTPAGDAAFNASLVSRFNANYGTTSSTFWTTAPSNPTVSSLFTTSNTYTRPGTAYLALWQILGKSTIVGVMQQIQHDYRGGTITEPQLEAEFHRALHNQSPECNVKLDQFFTQWFDNAYAPGGANTPNRPQITGPGLSGPGFFCAGLQSTGPATQVWGTPSTFSGVLTDQDGIPLASQAVTFSVDGGAPQPATTDENGDASFTPDGLLAPGAHTVALAFDGAGKYGATAGSATLVVVKADQTITFDPLPDTTFGALDFDVAATASSGLPVTIAASGSCDSSGLTVHITGAGSCTVTASQPGDDDYNAAPDLARTFVVARAPQSIAFGSLDDQTFGNADFDIEATASSHLPVSLAVSSGPCTVSAASSPASVHIAGAGTCTIVASQAGDGNYLAADDVSRSFSIGKAGQTIAFGALPAKTWGDPDFTVAATATSGLPVAYAAAGDCTLAPGGVVHLVSTGNCTITASQAGNDDYNPAPDVAQTFAIAKASQTITFAALAPGGVVHLVSTGNCTITASQAGNDDYNPAPDVAQTFAIAKASQTITFAALADRVFGGDFGVSATASSGLAVSFAAVAGSHCTVTGTTVHMTGTGSCGVVATQAGSANYLAAPSVTRTFQIGNSPAGEAGGSNLRPNAGGRADFDVAVETHGARAGSLRGSLVYVGPPPPRGKKHGPPLRFVAGAITAFGITPDGHAAWIAGTTIDHRSFRAYVEDNQSGHRPGRRTTDVFQLWIDDVPQTGDGSLDSGAITVSTR